MSGLISVIGWVAWAWVAIIAIKTLLAIRQCLRELGRPSLHLIRNILLFWIAVVIGLVMGDGRIHLVWLALLFRYFPSVWQLWWVRLGFGYQPHPGVSMYTLFLTAVMLCVSDLPSYSVVAEIASGLGWRTGLVHGLIFVLGLGIAAFVRRSFWRQLANAELGLRGNEPPLHRAAASGDISALDLLRSGGSDVSQRDSGGDTALHTAAFRGQTEAVRRLLSFGADPNVRRDSRGKFHDGWTPLHAAARFGQQEVMAVLLSNGADPNVRTNRDISPLHFAVLEDSFPIVELLLDHGATVDTSNEDGETPLHAAARVGSHAIVDLLLKHGSDPRAKDVSGRTPADLAQECGSTLILDRLNA